MTQLRLAVKLRRVTTGCYRVGDSDIRIQLQADGWRVTFDWPSDPTWLEHHGLRDALFRTRAAAARAIQAAIALGGAPPQKTKPHVRLRPDGNGGYLADAGQVTLAVQPCEWASPFRWEIKRGQQSLCLAATLDQARRTIQSSGLWPGADRA